MCVFVQILMSACSGSVAKRLKSAVKIGTHNGGFHCDELLACFMLTQLPQYKHADIIRSITHQCHHHHDCTKLCL